MTTGNITPQQVAETSLNHSCIKLVDNTYGELILPRVFNSPSKAIYELEVVINEKFICKSITLDKIASTWTYKEYVQEGNITVDDVYVEFNENEEIALNVENLRDTLTGDIAEDVTEFPNGGRIKTELDKWVPETRKVNGHALTEDIIIEASDISGAVPNTLKVCGHPLTTDITLSVRDVGLLSKTDTINGHSMGSDFWFTWDDLGDKAKHVYAHHICLSDSNSVFTTFIILDNTSTAYTTKADIGKALSRWHSIDTNALKACGVQGGYAHYCLVYGTSTGALYYRNTSGGWGNGNWNKYTDKVLQLF